MVTINDIQFNQHPAGVGFEGEYRFENGHGILVVCGPIVYNPVGADIEDKANALDYTTFQYLHVQPEVFEYAVEDWVGPVDINVVNSKMAEIQNMPETGGTGE